MKARGTRVDYLPFEEGETYRIIVFGDYQLGIPSKELIVGQEDLRNIQRQIMARFAPSEEFEKMMDEYYKEEEDDD